MAFPEQALGLKGELRVGTEWVNITGDLYTRDRITHTRGRPYRSNASDPASCSATIKNLDGKYTPRNPEGEFFGLIGRNSPFRISILGGPPYMSTTDSFLSNVGASTPDAAALNIAARLDARMEASLFNWDAAGSVELCGKGAMTGNQRSWVLMMRDGRLHFEWSADGASTIQVESTVLLSVPASRRLAVRVQLDFDNGASGSTTTFYTAPSIAGPWTQLGAPVVKPGTTSIFASTAVQTVGNGWPELAFPGPSGKVHAFELRNGLSGAVVANPDFTVQTPGVTSFTDGAGLTWTVLSGSEITNRVTRLEGEVPEWPPEWSASEQDAWTSITAAGILRRLGQGDKPLASTLRRRIPSGNPLAYWPLEDGRNATQFFSPISRVSPLKISGMDPATDSSLAGSSALPAIRGGAFMSGSVPALGASTTQWHTEFVFFMPNNGPATPRTVLQWIGTGTVKRWRLLLTTNGSQVFGYDANDNVVTSSLLDLSGLGVFNAWCRWQLFATQSGGTVNWNLRFIPIGGVGTGLVTTSYAGTVGRISGVRGPDSGYSSDLDGVIFGHLGVFATADTTIYNNADTGFAGETAGTRMQRLSQEEGVPLTIAGAIDETALVGPQTPAPLLDLLRECAEADGGIFGEAQDRRELMYRTRTSLYNQLPKLTLDYGSGQVAPPFKPVEDDSIRNVWEVKRSGGSSGTAVLDEGPLSVLDSPDGIGLYEDSATLNLYSDEQTEPMANWLLHLTTWDENRYPSVTVLLHKCPELIPDVLALQVGDKIRITGLPKRFTSSGAVELLVDGWTESFLPRAWEITFGCSPSGPWSVGVVGDAVLGKVDTDGSELATAVGVGDTAVSVAVTDGPLWTADPAETPWDIRVCGEVMTVTAVGQILNSNSSFDTNATGWTAFGGGTLGWQFSTSRGSGIARLMTGATASPRFEATSVPITTGQQYRASGWIFAGSALPAGVSISVNWYDAAGTFLSTSSNSRVPTVGQWALWDAVFTAPANAGKAGILLSCSGTPGAGIQVFGDDIRIVPVSSYNGSNMGDSFDRTVTSGWGAANTGDVWTTTGGNSSDYSVQGV